VACFHLFASVGIALGNTARVIKTLTYSTQNRVMAVSCAMQKDNCLLVFLKACFALYDLNEELLGFWLLRAVLGARLLAVFHALQVE
jgi:hypothetical protein